MTIKSFEEMLSAQRNLLCLADALLEELEKFDKAKDDFLREFSVDELKRISENPIYMKYARLIISLEYVEHPEYRETRLTLQDNINYNEEQLLKLQKN